MARQDSVADQVRDTASNLKDAYTFKSQRKAASDWFNDKVDSAKKTYNKYVGGSKVEASSTKEASAPKTTTAAKKPAAKKKNVKKTSVKR